ncbi:lysozyme M1 (1,4-beta-N-acetylmuramidase) [Chthonomonas calidirosea]|uniref:Lyzozyme M1 (1,4-beta-N-acetylmuramidase) n=1 Tax=Chthonomonas calidirosea (strain DSM 23976 / ICMP 18418 / T49) TaxID=1303518 RepID=S0EUA1_CHTCT|nr:Lyzozyme M1 (1,4-beta-N-acetylmuramidase) [Chthonomonas calidirosea T49]CEK19959.1 lysozyme M1 (1,4-beta-N-acetylmuramidase) [Chthonomonas calidirosea]CEK19961.1 lysozyme M1 (1,4-beta-N-acetylmuramidase) [Chthonomonas calidirosea]CEK20767.1 lysozyme M1 (1,4-beta-N-acetylmuramidase) [Chthonomonas calidirosea]
MLEGVDISHDDNGIDWEQVECGGIGFAFCKATEGTSIVDPYLERNLSGMRSVGIVRGVYHYFRCDEPGGWQAEFCIRTARRAGYDPARDLPIALDLEDLEGAQRIGKARLQFAVSMFLITARTMIGKLPIIYTSPAFWDEWMDGTDAYSGHPLWVAHYTGQPNPRLPKGWQKWTFWQYTPRGTVPGIPSVKETDRDRFHGEDIRALCGLFGIPIPACIRLPANSFHPPQV